MKKLAILLLIAAACSREQATSVKNTTTAAAGNVANTVRDAFDVSTPVGAREDPKAREQQRFDQQWRQLQSFRASQATPTPAQTAPVAPAVPIQFVKRTKETFRNLDVAAINNAPVQIPIDGDVRGPSVLKTQVYLDRLHFSVGTIDGRWGRNSAITVWWWQRTHGLPTSAVVDEATFRSIAAAAGSPPTVQNYALTEDDVKGPFVQIPDDVYDQQKLECLCYESLKEKLAEKFHADQDFLEVLNPNAKFSELKAGDTILVPNVRPALTADQRDVAKVIVSIAGNSLNGFDATGNLLFHAPTTVGAGYDPSPDETVKIVRIVPDPQFHYDPTLYHEVPDTNPDAHLASGPNSPVGVVWIALSKPHYGIHGTKDPEAIGYASSHGCIRLTNWDANELEHRVAEGVLVSFVDARKQDAPKVAAQATD
ncbi:MAG: L,D-transpeptidase family protein [Thermoanaerobaculia bacterium]